MKYDMEKDERRGFGKLSDRDSELLSALFDGELSADAAAELQERLHSDQISSRAGVEGALEGYTLLSRDLKQWFADANVDASGSPRKVDLWSRISVVLDNDAVLEAERYGWTRFLAPLKRSVDRLGDAVSRTVPRPALSFAVGTVAVMILVVSGTNQLRSTSAPGVAVSNTNPTGSEPRVVMQNVGARLTRRRSAHSPLLLVSEEATSNYRNRIESQLDRELQEAFAKSESLRPNVNASAAGSAANTGERMALRVPVGQIIDRNFVLGGLRADGADIHWVRSPRGVDLVPARNRREPPVIWVSRR